MIAIIVIEQNSFTCLSSDEKSCGFLIIFSSHPNVIGGEIYVCALTVVRDLSGSTTHHNAARRALIIKTREHHLFSFFNYILPPYFFTVAEKKELRKLISNIFHQTHKE
jgi:hypothetical protein